MSANRLAGTALILLATCLIPHAQDSSKVRQFEYAIERFAQSGQVDSFLFYCEARARLAQENDDLEGWINTSLDVADEYFESGDRDRWSAYLEQIAAGCWRLPRQESESFAWCCLQGDRGRSFAGSGNLLRAIEAFESAATVYEQYHFADFDAVEYIYKHLGNCYTRLGDNDKALAVFFKALLPATDTEILAGLYCNIGLAYWNKGDLEAAEQYCRLGLSLPGAPDDKRALLLGALAQTLLDKGATEQAGRYAAESMKLLPAGPISGASLEYRCYSGTTAGAIKIRQKQYPEAAFLIDAAARDARKAFGNHSRELGKIETLRAKWYQQQGMYRKSIDAANQALMAVLPVFNPQKPEQNPDVSNLYEENVIFEALALKARVARDLYDGTGDAAWLRLALDCHELAWQAESRLRRIYLYNSSKLQLQGETRAREASAMRVVRLLYDLSGETAYLEKAFQIAERSKAALLGEELRDNLVRQRLAGADTRFSALTSLQQRFSLTEKQLLLYPDSSAALSWHKERDLLQVDINRLLDQIRGDYPMLANQESNSAVQTADQLKPGEALIEYFYGPESFELFLLQQGHPSQWISVDISDRLRTDLHKFQAYFNGPQVILNDLAGYSTCAFQLFQQLLPVDLSGLNKLIVIPDGPLNFIPFDALIDRPAGAQAGLRDADYLLKRYEIRYAWSAGVLKQQQLISTKPGSGTLFVSPGFAAGERGLTPLAAVEGERPPNCRSIEKEQATLAAFVGTAGNYRILHLATHAFAGGVLPRLELYDQPLYLPGIFALPIQADLVTLSACETGIGRDQAGEGVMSLARAFSQAGAACVMSSLWPVNDRSTGWLLQRFYQNLEAGETTAQALRTARLAYLQDTGIRGSMQSPYFWAGFTVIGDDRKVCGNSWNMYLLCFFGLMAALISYFFLKRKQHPALKNESVI